MSDVATTCEQCGAKVAPNSQFCGDCGALVESAPIPTTSGTMVGISDRPAQPTVGATPASGGGSVPKKTLIGSSDMLAGLMAPPKPAPDSEPAPSSPASDELLAKPADPLKSTINGLSGEMPPVIPPESPLPAKPDEGTRTTSTGIAGPQRGKMGRTMLGMPMAAGTLGQRAGTLPPTGKLAEKKPAKTMFGMAGAPISTDTPQPGERVSMATIVAASPSERPAPEPAFGGGAKRDRSVLGQTAFGLPNPAAPAAQTDASYAWSETADSGGVSNTPLPPRMDDETSKISSSLTTRSPRVDASVTSRPPPPKSMLGPVMLAVAIVGVLALGAFLWLGQNDGPPVKVRIENENGAEKMVFEVAGAAPGSKLRFGGIEQAIEGGQAVFPLGSGSLQVGRNAVLFDVLQPGGDSEAGKVVLSLDYRVTVDTAPLQTGKGAVDVVVAALPGSKVWIGGEELALDAQGRAQRRQEIETSTLKEGKSVEHVVSYRVQPPSQEPQVGQIKTVVPIASLEIDRPGLVIMTDRDSVEIAGRVDADSTLTLNGEPIAVQDGRFLHRLPLPAPGKHEPELIARATGKAPRAVKLSIERVADLAAAARAFAPDASLTYAKIAQNPEIYAGQKAQFEGRVYNVSVDGGRSVLQMLVRDCPAGVRCPLWVDYGAATDLTVEKWVRAVGTLAGAQKFRAENGTEQTVPRLSAVVLVPIEP
jgi:hypothetical protein